MCSGKAEDLCQKIPTTRMVWAFGWTHCVWNLIECLGAFKTN